MSQMQCLKSRGTVIIAQCASQTLIPFSPFRSEDIAWGNKFSTDFACLHFYLNSKDVLKYFLKFSEIFVVNMMAHNIG